MGRGEVSNGHWFEELADHMGEAYLRYSFTKGTKQEVDFLLSVLDLAPGARILDVGCGPGRHAHELATRGFLVHGIDISARFIDVARESAPQGSTFEVADARTLTFDEEFDAVVCLCQGAFGLMVEDGGDEAVLRSIVRALRCGGQLALSAFNSFFVVKHQQDSTFDVERGVNHERTEVRSPEGLVKEVDLWTGCYTPRELRMLMAEVGLDVRAIHGVEPGRYSLAPPSLECPEHLVIALKTPSHRLGS
ncbi:MAG: hypothetical protein RL419_1630 [Actinomycetota bacterium]